MRDIEAEAQAAINTLHRHISDSLPPEAYDLSPVQALILARLVRMGEPLFAKEMRGLGLYFGSNASYNLKQMVARGYLLHHQDTADRRRVVLSPTVKGRRIGQAVLDDPVVFPRDEEHRHHA